ncbi:MAG: terminase small subunit [Carnobacterium sp.]
MVPMNKRQKAFADEYLICGNATEAYGKAGYKVDNEAAANVSASKLLRNPKVSEYIDERLKEIESEKIASAEEVLQILTMIARGQRPEYQAVTVKSQEPITVTSAKGEEYEKIVYVERIEQIALPTRNADINRAAELLGKRYRLFTDRQEIEMTVPIFVNNIPEDDDDGD